MPLQVKTVTQQTLSLQILYLRKKILLTSPGESGLFLWGSSHHLVGRLCLSQTPRLRQRHQMQKAGGSLTQHSHGPTLASRQVCGWQNKSLFPSLKLTYMKKGHLHDISLINDVEELGISVTHAVQHSERQKDAILLKFCHKDQHVFLPQSLLIHLDFLHQYLWSRETVVQCVLSGSTFKADPPVWIMMIYRK